MWNGKQATGLRSTLAAVIRGEQIAARACEDSGCDVSELVQHAIREGCAGLLLRAVEAGGEEFDKAAMRSLRRAASLDGANALRVLHASQRVIAVLNGAGVPALVLKGVSLHAMVYDRPDLRPVSDLDLLVRPEKAERAAATLVALGCHRGMDLIHPEFFPRYYYEAEFLSPPPENLRIDLHVRPFRPPRYARLMPDDAMWKGADSVGRGDGRMLAPSPERMLIHLAAHAAFHGCSRLIWLYDLKAFLAVHGDRMDWELFLRLAGEWKLAGAVRSGIDEAESLFGGLVPARVRAALNEVSVSWADRLVLRSAPCEAGSPLRSVLVHLLTTPGTRWKLGYALVHVVPSREHLREAYSGRHFGWTFVAQLLRLMRHLRRLVQSLATLPRRWAVPALAKQGGGVRQADR
ncbi:MAG: nucleotidyltransferase family protein [Phycisphaerae bacterium]|nr:nucleotidyltransferase family protein [Phycisphaerae bacterium]